MRETFLPFSPPLIGEEEIAEVAAALRSDWLTTGPRTRQFEQDLAAYVGAPAALALNSCTAALHVALAALGVGPGDEVISTPMTFVSSIHVIGHVGARPVLVDVETDTLNIDPDRIEAAITPRTRAILPVHLYGHPADMEAIGDIARRHGLAVVEDAAHALPARQNGRLVGTPLEGVRSLAAFSFYATKNLTTGEGGMLTGDAEVIDGARVWALHGMSRDAFNRYSAEGSWRYDVVAPGFKYNLSDLQAAIGLVQLRRLGEMQARRRQIFEAYNAGFRALEELELPVERPGVESALHLYVVRLNLDLLTIDRARFIEELKARNIGTSVHFIPVHQHSYYRERYGYAPDAYPVAAREFERIVSLPLNPRMTDGDVADVIEAVEAVLRAGRR